MRRVTLKITLEVDRGGLSSTTALGRSFVAVAQLSIKPSALARLAVKSFHFSAAREERRKTEGWVSVADILETHIIPRGSAEVISRALDVIQRQGIASRFVALEMLAANFLAGIGII